MIIEERLAFGGGSGATSSSAPETTPAPAVATRPDRAAHQPRDWAYAGLLAFTAVLLFRPQDQIKVLEPFHLAQVCALAALAAMLVGRLRRHLTLVPLTPETIGLMCLGFVMLATVPFSIWPGGALSVIVDAYLKAVMVFLLMINTLTTPKRLEQITWLILVCCGYIAFRAVFDYARGINLVENGRVAGAVSGIFGNPNDLALNMVTFLPLALTFALLRRYSAARRLAAAGFAVLMMATVVFTKSRAGVLGLGLMLVAFLFLGRKIRPAFTAAVLAATLLATPFLPASFWNRMATIGDEDQDKAEFTGSTQARRILLQEGLDAFLENPITGVGAGQFKSYNPTGRQERWHETHNALLQVAADTGIFGFAAFVFLIACGALASFQARRMLSKPRRHAIDRLALTVGADDRRFLYAFATASAASLIGWFVCAFFASVAYGWTFYYLLALLVATRDLVASRLALARDLAADNPAGHPSADGSIREKEKGPTWTPQIA
jgi:O-antigen ligase